jgi:hypothetical protein
MRVDAEKIEDVSGKLLRPGLVRLHKNLCHRNGGSNGSMGGILQPEEHFVCERQVVRTALKLIDENAGVDRYALVRAQIGVEAA